MKIKVIYTGLISFVTLLAFLITIVVNRSNDILGVKFSDNTYIYEYIIGKGYVPIEANLIQREQIWRLISSLQSEEEQLDSVDLSSAKSGSFYAFCYINDERRANFSFCQMDDERVRVVVNIDDMRGNVLESYVFNTRINLVKKIYGLVIN